MCMYLHIFYHMWYHWYTKMPPYGQILAPFLDVGYVMVTHMLQVYVYKCFICFEHVL
jgi:hypothetical protein